MELLGHSQLSETLKRYTKVREGLKRQALDRLDKLLRSADGGGADDQTDDQSVRELLSNELSLAAWFGLRDDDLNSKIGVPAAGFEPAHFGLKELARLSVWPELRHPARSDRKIISS